jgi:hypothetical protein
MRPGIQSDKPVAWESNPKQRSKARAKIATFLAASQSHPRYRHENQNRMIEALCTRCTKWNKTKLTEPLTCLEYYHGITLSSLSRDFLTINFKKHSKKQKLKS